MPGNAAPPLAFPETDRKATAGLICGLLSFIFPLAVAAIVLGHISRSEIRKSRGRLTGSGKALIGLVLGYSVGPLVPILLIAALAIPNLTHYEISANEASAVAAIRSINTAEIAYSLTRPDAGYTCSLPDLNSPSASIGELANGEMDGYRFRLQDCTHKTYAVIAVPISRQSTGTRAFCSKENAVVRFDPNGSAENCLAHGQEVDLMRF